MEPNFTPPSDADTKQLASQWLSVSRLAEEEYGCALIQSLDDLPVLQRLLDEDVIDKDAYALQCLGVALGRVMATNIEGMDWWIVEDEYGRDPCLRYLETALHLNPLTMISKRIERGESVDIQRLFEKSKKSIADLRREID
jgi:hypothetical protein